MRQSKLILFSLALGGILFAASCKNDDLSIKSSNVGLSLTNPEGLTDVKTSNLVLNFKEVNSGVVTTFNLGSSSGLSDIKLPEGSYSVNLEGDVEYKMDNTTYNSKIRGYQNNLVVKGSTVELNIPLFLYNPAAKFVFKEIFFSGTKTPAPANKVYNGDKYFILYNNSADTLYADGLVIAESAYLTTTKRDYTPNIMNEAFTAGSVVMIPGTGKQYPVLPGKQIVVANNAINHLPLNANSLDLTGSDFELTLLNGINVDNPQVTDLINISSAMTMHNRGFKSYVIARLPQGATVDSYKKDNFYTYSYVAVNGNVLDFNAYKIPNAWIEDAVNLSVASMFEWIVTAPGLDVGWTYCGKVDSDETRYGKSVRRKVLSTNPDGRVILKDNNNSTVDFDAEVKPSLMK